MKSFIALSFVLFATLASTQNTYPDLAIIFSQGNKRTRVLLSDIATFNPATLPFNPSMKTVVDFPGYKSDASSGSRNLLQTALETLGGYNFIIIDWSTYNHGSYVDAVNSVSPIAKKYAAILVDLVSQGLITVISLHFIGFSLGAHLAGNLAREAKLLSPTFNVPRITALDPANYHNFTQNMTAYRNFQGLQKTDAGFVDAIHTDVLFFGIGESVGTVDFFPNNAVNPQPGCSAFIMTSVQYPLSNLCSHLRAGSLFEESITNTNINAFASKKCTGTTTASKSSVTCSQLEATASGHMGFHAAMTMTGNYFLETNGDSPYTK